jgi:hypothetical protein
MQPRERRVGRGVAVRRKISTRRTTRMILSRPGRSTRGNQKSVPLLLIIGVLDLACETKRMLLRCQKIRLSFYATIPCV